MKFSSNGSYTIIKNLTDIILRPDRLIFINLIILLIYETFGTGLPSNWEAKKADQAYYQESSNVRNQVVFIFLFMASVFALVGNLNSLIAFIKREKYLSILVAYCVISLIWSEESFISFKRSFQLFVEYLVILMAVLFIKPQKALNTMRVVITLYILTTFFLVMTFPQAVDPAFNTWRGFTAQKNGLAQIALFCFLSSLFFYSKEDSTLTKYWNYGITGSSVLIIFMASSSTIILVFIIIVGILIFIKISKIFSVIGMGKVIFVTVISFVVILLFLIGLFAGEVFALITDIFEKDLSFTGRTIYWPYLLGDVQKKLLLGWGFGTYWVLGSEHIYRLFIVENLVMNTAHNGFIDLALQVGLIGFIIFIIMVVVFFRRSLKTDNYTAVLYLIAMLMSNITSTVFLGDKSLTFGFFYFYLMISKSYYMTED